MHLHAAGDVAITWKSATNDVLAASLTVAQSPYYELPFNPAGWFDCTAGEALQLALGGAVQVGGFITYQILT